MLQIVLFLQFYDHAGMYVLRSGVGMTNKRKPDGTWQPLTNGIYESLHYVIRYFPKKLNDNSVHKTDANNLNIQFLGEYR